MRMKNMILKHYKIGALLVIAVCFTSCKIVSKPKLEKFHGYQSGEKYNTHKFYSASFEAQIDNHAQSMINIELNYLDSTYQINLTKSDSIQPIHEKFVGKYILDEKGKIALIGSSPFKDNLLQIVVLRSQKSLFAEFKLNTKYGEIFTNKKRIAYCEIDFPWELRDCLIE